MQTFHSLRRTARSLGLVTVGVLSTLGALSLSHVGPAQAQSPGVNLAQLVAQVNTLKAQVAVLQAKTAPLSLSNDPNAGGTNTLLTIKGVNVQIVSGSGYTDDGTQGEVKGAKLTGLGNLILGYNAAGNDQGKGDVRTGSHNLILGDQSNYSSFGGLVAGDDNTISGPYASVSGGQLNTASSPFASVNGGYGNTASNYYASVSGGYRITQRSENGWSGGSYHTP